MLDNKCPTRYLLTSLELIYKCGGPGLSGCVEKEAHIYKTEVLVRKVDSFQSTLDIGLFFLQVQHVISCSCKDDPTQHPFGPY